MVNDYEGITGYEKYRDDLRLLYFLSVEPDTGGLHEVRITPFQTRRMRFRRASQKDCRWLRERLGRISSGFGSCVAYAPEGMLTLGVDGSPVQNGARPA